MTDVFWACNMIFTDSCNPKQYRSRIFLFTPNDNPCDENTDKTKIITRAKDVQDNNIEIELFPLEINSKKFDVSKFYHDILLVDENFMESSRCRLQDIQTRVRLKSHSQRVLSNLKLEIGVGLEMAVTMHSSVQEAKLPYPIKLHLDDNKPLKSETSWICEQTGTLLGDNEIDTYWECGGTTILCSKADKSEIETFDKPGILLIGFKPIARLKNHHNIGSAKFLYPNNTVLQGSTTLAHALILKMKQRQMAAIVRVIPRQNASLMFWALLPQEHVSDEETGECIASPGFHMIPLPFADDIRSLELPSTKPIEDQMMDPVLKSQKDLQAMRTMKQIIKNIQISNFDVRQVDNPVLQKHHAAIQALALGEDEPEETPDLLLPDVKKIDDSIAASVVELKTIMFNSPNHSLAPTKRAPPKISSPPGAKRPRVNDTTVGTDENMKKLVESNLHSKLTVVELKEWLKARKQSVVGKKNDLVQRVSDYVANNC
eukprot:GHVL01019500.1.p1 GENE.GHVL01019500.1~~GHVL01019500.1.p1  ORF type:complete len:487 (+),score=74.52 GHVL01019500.1:710-2170(+)